MDFVCDFRDKHADVFWYLMCHYCQNNIDGGEDGCSCYQEQPIVLGKEADDLRYGDSAGRNQQKWQNIGKLLPRRVVDEFLDKKAIDEGDEMVVDGNAAKHEDKAEAIRKKHNGDEF